MPDYMFLLESRLSPEQRAVLERVQELSRSQDMNVYLTGGAIRDLISGQPIRDLDFTIEGNPQRMVRELEKGGARVVWESEKLRHYEMIFAGDVDGSISSARDEVYERPGAKPEYRLSSIMDDLRRRDFSINAIAISLNAQSLGLLLDPTNGLADLERQEVRALSIHAFTNQPIRLLRILRYCARMGARMESRTKEWFDLAIQREMNQNIESAELGHEMRAVAREEAPVATLKEWEGHDLLAAIHPQLQRRKPDYESLNKLTKVRGNYLASGIRPRTQNAVTYYTLSRMKPREATGALRNMEFRANEIDAIERLISEAQKIVKVLKSRKTNTPREAYNYLASAAPDMLAFIEVEMPNATAVSKIRNYVQKWRPMHLALPVNELDALGVPRGAKFDKILEQLFEKQLRGKAREPEERTKALRELAGIKEELPKKPEKKRKGKELGPLGAVKTALPVQGGKAATRSEQAKPGTPAGKPSHPSPAQATPHPPPSAGVRAPAKPEKAQSSGHVVAKRASGAHPKPLPAKKSRRR